MAPTAHLEPGVVQAYGAREVGVIDVGRYPSGVDALAEEVTDALEHAGISSVARPDVMRFKHAKLLSNLGNAVDAICVPGPAAEEVTGRAREEGESALSAAGIEFEADEVDDVVGRWRRLDVQPIEGRPRAGSSTRQSLARGTAAVETDYLNGEIALIGRLHAVPTPVNDALCELSARHLRERRGPGTLPAEELLGTRERDATRMDQFVATAPPTSPPERRARARGARGDLLALGRCRRRPRRRSRCAQRSCPPTRPSSACPARPREARRIFSRGSPARAPGGCCCSGTWTPSSGTTRTRRCGATASGCTVRARPT